MSFSSQILTFLGVSAIYIGFTFIWAWYKGKQDSEDIIANASTEPDDHGGTATTESEDTMNTDDGTDENGGEH